MLQRVLLIVQQRQILQCLINVCVHSSIMQMRTELLEMMTS